MTQLAGKIANRVCRHLARNGWLEGEDESAFLSERAGGDDGMDALRMSSITYRIATGMQVGRKVVSLQTLPGDAGPLEGDAGNAEPSDVNANTDHRTPDERRRAMTWTQRLERAAKHSVGVRRTRTTMFAPLLPIRSVN